MSDNEKKTVSDETCELTDEQISDAAGGTSARARAEKARKKAQKQRQAADLSRLGGTLVGAGTKISAQLIQDDAPPLAAKMREDFDEPTKVLYEYEEGEWE